MFLTSSVLPSTPLLPNMLYQSSLHFVPSCFILFIGAHSAYLTLCAASPLSQSSHLLSLSLHKSLHLKKTSAALSHIPTLGFLHFDIKRVPSHSYRLTSLLSSCVLHYYWILIPGILPLSHHNTLSSSVPSRHPRGLSHCGGCGRRGSGPQQLRGPLSRPAGGAGSPPTGPCSALWCWW